MQIAFIGLGIMGSRMAMNVLQGGHTLTVHNRTRAKAEALEAAGARWADTPAECAAGAEVVLTMLSAPEAVSAMALGPEGLLAGMNAGGLWVDCSTVNPSFAREMAAVAQARGVRYLDAPVAGTKGPAEQGELAFFVGGDCADVQTADPLFELMGKARSHIGPVGQGAAMKMVLNMLLAQAMQGFAEALVLGQSLGLPKAMLLESLLGGRMTAPYLASKREKLESGRFPADFPLQWMHKDLQLVDISAYESNVVLPMASAARQSFGHAKRQGLGEQDFSAIYAFLQAQDLL